ncbi:MAG: tail fiber domain-containing protein [Chitinophagales bacterium]
MIILMSILGLKVSVAQQNVGIGTLTPNPNALLELVSNDKGFLVPRIDDTQRAALALTLNNTSDRGLLTYDLTEKLFYFWDGTAWIPFPGGSGGTDDQLLAIDVATNLLSIESGNSVDLSPYLDNTDDQVITNFSWDSLTQELTISIEDGNTQTVNIPFASVGNTDDQAISISNDTIYLEDGGFVVLPSGTVDTDDQTLTVTNQSSDSVSIQIADGNEVTFNIEDADADPTNELQDLIQLSDTSFVISGTNDTIVINSPAGTDDQAISISNDTIYLEDGGFVVLPSGTVDTDDQTLTVTNQSSDSVSIQIADGNEVTFNIEDADADPTNELQDLIQLSDTSFVITGTNDTIVINSPAGTDDQIISISNDTIYLEDGGFVVLPDLYDHDWYKMGTTNAPDDINDTIWTEGVVVIGTNSGAVIGDTINTALIVDGNILPTVCGAFDLGSLSYKWRQLFVTSVAGFYACSDKSLKRNIKDIGYGLDHILKLEAVKYQWRDSVNLGLNFELGLIAQDVYRIIPDIVHVPDRTIENDVYSISYLEFIPILIQAIQDQQRIIDDQQSQIDDLKVKNQNNEIFKVELDNIRSENDALKYRLENIEEFMRHLKQEVNKE